jgi:hypothetical protein
MKNRRHVGVATTRLAVAALLLAVSWESPARAQLITTNPGLPPGPNGGYKTAAQVHATYPGVQISQVDHTGFNSIQLAQSGNNQIESFNSSLFGVATIGAVSVPFQLIGPVQIEVFNKYVNNVEQTTGTWSTQMLSMDMTGNVAGHSVEIMLDPALGSSTGSTTVAPLGGGQFRIDSFFDVFTEISLDHGAFQGQTDGPTHVTLQTVPEPSIWIMLAAAGLIVPGFLRLQRRRA